MKISQLRKVIHKLLLENLNKPMLERDDIGTFYTVFHPQGGEKLEELMLETDVASYGTKVGDRQIAAIVRSEGRARRMAETLRQGKINEMAGAKQQEINAKMKEMKETKALMGAMSHYFKLKEADPGNNTKWKKYQETLQQQQAEINELQKQKKEIEEGKIPKNMGIQSQPHSQQQMVDEDTVNIELDEVKKKKKKLKEQQPRVPQPSTGNSKAHITHQKDDIVDARLKEAQPRVPTPSSPNQKSHLTFQKDDITIAGLKETKKKKKPSSGLSKKKKSATVKKARKGGDIGKKGKNFGKVVAKAAKEYGSEEAGKKVAASAMWRNAKR